MSRTRWHIWTGRKPNRLSEVVTPQLWGINRRGRESAENAGGNEASCSETGLLRASLRPLRPLRSILERRRPRRLSLRRARRLPSILRLGRLAPITGSASTRACADAVMAVLSLRTSESILGASDRSLSAGAQRSLEWLSDVWAMCRRQPAAWKSRCTRTDDLLRAASFAQLAAGMLPAELPAAPEGDGRAGRPRSLAPGQQRLQNGAPADARAALPRRGPVLHLHSRVARAERLGACYIGQAISHLLAGQVDAAARDYSRTFGRITPAMRSSGLLARFMRSPRPSAPSILKSVKRRSPRFPARASRPLHVCFYDQVRRWQSAGLIYNSGTNLTTEFTETRRTTRRGEDLAADDADQRRWEF